MNKQAKVCSLNCDGDIQRRLLDLGLINGTKIKPILKSPLGDPIAYEIRGALIAIRNSDSRLINLEL